MTLNLEEICTSVRKLCEVTASYIQSEKGKIKAQQIEVKGLNDFVTRVDKTSEQMIVEGLEPLLPGAGFITEENTRNNKGELYNWIVDPLDGTTNFIHGAPCYCISIALLHQDKIILGVIYEINQQESFYAWEQGGAYLNGNPIQVSTTTGISNSLLATGFPYHDYQYINEYLELFKYFMQHSHGLRRLGSAAADMAYVAAGRFEGFYEYGLKAWDVAAGCIIIKEAGGKLSDFNGGDNFVFGQEIICSNSNIFNDFQSVISKFMRQHK